MKVGGEVVDNTSPTIPKSPVLPNTDDTNDSYMGMATISSARLVADYILGEKSNSRDTVTSIKKWQSADRVLPIITPSSARVADFTLEEGSLETTNSSSYPSNNARAMVMTFLETHHHRTLQLRQTKS